jgi:hypothetical protein
MKARVVFSVPAAKKGAHAGRDSPPPRIASGPDPTPEENIPCTKPEAVPVPGFKTPNEKGIGGFPQTFSKSILLQGNTGLRRGSSMRKGEKIRRYFSAPLHIICNAIAIYPKTGGGVKSWASFSGSTCAISASQCRLAEGLDTARHRA